jgi:Lon protease-like protein
VPVPARLPLFPLPLVLFPGAALPLHVFEPRYRRLLADVRAADGRFGIVLAGDARGPAPGLVGCVAAVRDVEPLPDGRSNLVVEGRERFAVARVVEADAPYLVAEVAPYDDAPEDDAAVGALAAATARVRTLFARVARAARAIADDVSPVPDLPGDPADGGVRGGRARRVRPRGAPATARLALAARPARRRGCAAGAGGGRAGGARGRARAGALQRARGGAPVRRP